MNGKDVNCVTLVSIQAKEPAMGARAVTIGTQWIGKRMVKKMRPIDADALKEFIDDCGICAICPHKAPRCSYDCDFPDFVTEKWNVAIDAQPTIDAVSVVRGEMGFYIEELPTELNGITMQEADYLADEFLKDTPCNRMWDAMRALRDFYEIVTSEAVEVADRKTENSSEKPNNSKERSE